MIPILGYDGKVVGVLGLGRSGLAAAKALEASGAMVLAWDDHETARGKALERGLNLHDFTRNGAFDGVEVLIVSPGIAHLYPTPHPVIARALALGVAIDNDIGLFFRSFATETWNDYETAPRVIAVTGANGKSTTSALIAHILEEVGRPWQLAGNIGRGVLDIEPARDGEVVVLELSSYQTELARALTPDVAVFTNLSPDHLDRHAGMGGYFSAKRRLFTEGGPDRAVIGVDELEGQFLANQLGASAADDRVIRISSGQKLDNFAWSVFVRKGFLAEWRRGKQVASIDLRQVQGLPGAHNHQNAAAAYAALRALGVGPKQIEAALASFAGLPHRSQTIGTKNCVRFVNDSKATNVDSARKALTAFENIRWIAGGQAKEGGISALSNDLGAVVKAYLIGDAAHAFAQSLGATQYEICTTMAQAVEAAVRDAKAGDVVLLSPAAASFDQYDNFEKRGDDFAAHVQAYLEA